MRWSGARGPDTDETGSGQVRKLFSIYFGTTRPHRPKRIGMFTLLQFFSALLAHFSSINLNKWPSIFLLSSTFAYQNWFKTNYWLCSGILEIPSRVGDTARMFFCVLFRIWFRPARSHSIHFLFMVRRDWTPFIYVSNVVRIRFKVSTNNNISIDLNFFCLVLLAASAVAVAAPTPTWNSSPPTNMPSIWRQLSKSVHLGNLNLHLPHKYWLIVMY